MFARRAGLVGLLIAAALASVSVRAAEMPEVWKTWLAEVAPIMSRAEAAVFKSLGTEEDRKRFQTLFWRVRDPVPGTPENEFQADYYKRFRYAESRLGGAATERGRIYLVLGKPAEIQTFAGSDTVVDCELWIYRATGRPGVPPLLYLLFYRKDVIDDFHLFYPGMNSPLEILSPSSGPISVSRGQAVRMIRKAYPELAKATLSVIPDEADINAIGGLGSSSTVIAQVLSLPEREIEKAYLRGFGSPQGTVDVSYTTREVAGKAALAVTRHAGIAFLGYSLMPDELLTVRNKDGFDTAHLVLNARIEDSSGRTIWQGDREMSLKLDAARKAAVETNKMVFNDLVPVIDGRYSVSLTFSNKTTDEFFVHREEITVAPERPLVIAGYKIKELPEGMITPLSLGRYKVLSDPRSIFGRGESLEGLILSAEKPEVRLVPWESGAPPIEVTDVTRDGDVLLFRQSLVGIGPGNYDLVVRVNGAEVCRRRVSVLSFVVEKPLELERTESLAARDALLFELGQEHLNAGRPDLALGIFEKLPESLWRPENLPVIARAYYLQKDFARAAELLERPGVERTYAVLLVLGNASLELHRLDRAAEYFELLRKYGDTVENNRVLSAIYLSLGQSEKSRICRERAEALEKERAVRKESK